MGKTRILLILPALLLAACGQVDRQMRIDSQPSGALVYLNGQEVGRTPCTVDFTWYGKYDVALRKEGYPTLKTTQNVSAPWWQWIPLDLVADLTPGRKVDTHQYFFVIPTASATTIPADVLVKQAQTLKHLLQSGELTRIPTTQPSPVAVDEPSTTLPAPVEAENP